MAGRIISLAGRTGREDKWWGNIGCQEEEKEEEEAEEEGEAEKKEERGFGGKQT